MEYRENVTAVDALDAIKLFAFLVSNYKKDLILTNRCGGLMGNFASKSGESAARVTKKIATCVKMMTLATYDTRTDAESYIDRLLRAGDALEDKDLDVRSDIYNCIKDTGGDRAFNEVSNAPSISGLIFFVEVLENAIASIEHFIITSI